MSLTAVRAGAYLHHVAFESADPKRLADFYADAMDMTAEPVGDGEWRCSGPARRFVVKRGEGRKLAYAGLACRDADGLAELRARAESEGITLLANPSPYFEDGAFAVEAPDGHVIVFGLAKPEAATQPGLKGPTQHLTFATLDVEAFQDFFHGKLGFALSDRVVH